jgi:hypothetical protein
MSTLLLLIALVFIASGGLAILNISNIGLDLVSKTRIHLLPILNTFPIAWVYLFVGFLFLFMAEVFSRS